MQQRKACIAIGLVGVLLTSAAAHAQIGKPGRPSASAPPADAAQPAPATGEIRTARDLLEALEVAGEDLNTLEARIVYDRRFKLQGDRHVRRGTLYFRNQPAEAAPRTFAILFKNLQIDQRVENSPQTWVFDGRWLVEMRVNEKQFIKREVARPGEPFDPLKIGEGPMPIPIGQKADEIERRYDAQLMEPRSGLPDTWNLPGWIDDTWQIVLTPRRSGEDEFESIRLWYEKESLLPRMAMTRNRSGDESIVFLDQLVRNEPLPRNALSVEEPPEGSGWRVQIERLPDADAAPEANEGIPDARR